MITTYLPFSVDRAYKLWSSSHPRGLVTLCFPFCLYLSALALAAEPGAGAEIERLIDSLIETTRPAPGLHNGTSYAGFFCSDKPPLFLQGVLGTEAPAVTTPMRELVKLGPAAVPYLLTHLDDNRPTRLAMDLGYANMGFFTAGYDPRERHEKQTQPPPAPPAKKPSFPYAVKVGDICFVLLGQIVNREYEAIHFQPSSLLFINSPVEAPQLADRARKDWTGLSTDQHRTGLIKDATSGDEVREFGPALERLRFYYPEEFSRLKKGQEKSRIATFELWEKPR